MDSVHEGLKDFDMAKMVQVLIDGSNVNLKLFKKLKEQRNELGSPGLIDFGSCDLHIFMVPLNPVLRHVDGI